MFLDVPLSLRTVCSVRTKGHGKARIPHQDRYTVTACDRFSTGKDDAWQVPIHVTSNWGLLEIGNRRRIEAWGMSRHKLIPFYSKWPGHAPAW